VLPPCSAHDDGAGNWAASHGSQSRGRLGSPALEGATSVRSEPRHKTILMISQLPLGLGVKQRGDQDEKPLIGLTGFHPPPVDRHGRWSAFIGHTLGSKALTGSLGGRSASRCVLFRSLQARILRKVLFDHSKSNRNRLRLMRARCDTSFVSPTTNGETKCSGCLAPR